MGLPLSHYAVLFLRVNGILGVVYEHGLFGVAQITQVFFFLGPWLLLELIKLLEDIAKMPVRVPSPGGKKNKKFRWLLCGGGVGDAGHRLREPSFAGLRNNRLPCFSGCDLVGLRRERAWDTGRTRHFRYTKNPGDCFRWMIFSARNYTKVAYKIFCHCQRVFLRWNPVMSKMAAVFAFVLQVMRPGRQDSCGRFVLLVSRLMVWRDLPACGIGTVPGVLFGHESWYNPEGRDSGVAALCCARRGWLASLITPVDAQDEDDAAVRAPAASPDTDAAVLLPSQGPLLLIQAALRRHRNLFPMIKTIRRVAVIGGNRLPFARSNTAYARASNQDLLTATLRGLVTRYALQGERLGEVVAGAVIKHPRDFNLTRESVLSTDLDPQTPCYDIGKACGTGLEAAFCVANKIALGQIECGIAGGTDTASDVPIGVSEGLRRILLDLNRSKNWKERLLHISRLRPAHLVPNPPANKEPRTGLSMGGHAELTAKEWNISRKAQDALALTSHQRLAAAWDEGFFDDLVTPFLGLARDNILRGDTSLEQLARLAPVFDKKTGKGTLTAGNSSSLTDGASAVLLASEDWAARRQLPVLAFLTFCETTAVDFFGAAGPEKEGLLQAPAYAVPSLLHKAQLGLQDFDFYEIHEAFAAQVLATLAAWESEAFCTQKLGLAQPLGAIDRSKLNVCGGSLATGHPFAATGGRILAGLAKLLAKKGSGRGLISLCAAGGQGLAAVLERP